MSSGQYVTTTTRTVECDGTVRPVFLKGTPLEFRTAWPCRFADEVDITVDPEGRTALWICPVCGAEHEVDFDDLLEPDPDFWTEFYDEPCS